MQIFDTHYHLNLEPLTSQWPQYHDQAMECGVVGGLIVGTDETSNQSAIEIASQSPSLFACVGIHPENLSKITSLSDSIAELSKLLDQPKVVAIGEAGLDYYRLDEAARAAQRAAQHDLLVAQIILAKQYQLPLVLHVRDDRDEAYQEVLELIEQHWNFQTSLIFHCVSGPLSYIDTAMHWQNTYFGFDGNLTFKNAENLREIFRFVQAYDDSRILLETDAPFLAPMPHRGKVCEPAMIVDTAIFAKEQLGANLAKIYQNSLQAFKLKL
jgi:TatD DNase family protein